MMLLAKSTSLLMILAATCGRAQNEPSTTPSPSAAPTSAPTVAPETNATPSIICDVCDEPAENESSTSAVSSNSTSTISSTSVVSSTSSAPASTASTTSASTTSSSANMTGVVYTQFTAKLTVADAGDFNTADYVASIAASTGVVAEKVHVVSVDFVVSASYKFAESVTEAEVVEAVAANAGVEQSAVNATITAARRLSLGRRLAVTADVTISTQSPTIADNLKTVANNAGALATKLSEVTFRTISVPEVTIAPELNVLVVTHVVSADATAVAAPSAAEIAREMSQRTGKTITVEVMDVEMTGDVPSTTTGQSAGETSGAPRKSGPLTFSLLLAMGFALLVAS